MHKLLLIAMFTSWSHFILCYKNEGQERTGMQHLCVKKTPRNANAMSIADKSFLPLKLLYQWSVVISGSGLVCVFECVQQDAPDVPKFLLGLAHLGLLAVL